MKTSKVLFFGFVILQSHAWNAYCSKSWSIEDGIDSNDAKKVMGVYQDYYEAGKKPPAPSVVAKKTQLPTLEVRTIVVSKGMELHGKGVKKLQD